MPIASATVVDRPERLSDAQWTHGVNRPVLLIIGSVPPPFIGPTLAMQRLLESSLLQERFEVVFLDLSDRRPPENIGKLDLGNVWQGLVHAFQCLGLLLRRRPRLVYLGISQGTWGYLRDLCFILPSLFLRRRLVIHLRGSEFRSFYAEMLAPLRWLTRKVLSQTERVIVLGDCLRSVFAGWVPPERIDVVPNGINYRAFDGAAPLAVRKDSAIRLLYLASLMKRKGLFLLLEAMPLVLHRQPEATLDIAGLWQSREEQQEAEALIQRLGLESKVKFIGEVLGEEKVRVLKSHDLLVFPPIAPEGLPWVILEAMSAGLPVISTDQGAIREVVQDGTTGLLATPDPQNLSAAILRLASDRSLRERMGSAGRSRVEAEFSEGVYFRRMVESLSKAAGIPARSGPAPAAG